MQKLQCECRICYDTAEDGKSDGNFAEKHNLQYIIRRLENPIFIGDAVHTHWRI